MTKQERLAYRILASLYPDRKPSEIRRIIDKALEKEENPDDIELWAIMTREQDGEKTKTEEVTKKIIEEHHYHHHDYRPYWTTTLTGTIGAPEINPCVVTCDNGDYTISGAISNLFEGVNAL